MIAVGLHLKRNKLILFGGISTLFALAAKLFIFDLSYVDAIWRIYLFLSFGGLFLLVSYYFQNLLRGGQSCYEWGIRRSDREA